MNRPLRIYYAATILFVLLDFVLGVNVRAAFLDDFPAARLAYYVFCYACLALMLWRPTWAVAIAVLESLVSVVALTMSMAIRTMIVTDEMIETGARFVSSEEIFNYVIVGGIAYFGYIQGIKRLKEPNIGKIDDMY